MASEAAEHIARERALFAARRRTLDEQVGSLQMQIREAHAQAAALQTQIAATETSGGRVRFFRDVANVTMDLNDVRVDRLLTRRAAPTTSSSTTWAALT